MPTPANINPRIIETLYSEALVLSDEVRAAFCLSVQDNRDPEDTGRIALSGTAADTAVGGEPDATVAGALGVGDAIWLVTGACTAVSSGAIATPWHRRFR